ncbi:MAG: AAA family ATPase, partial [Clostridiales Family XIII bacterium]|nr:AAA family ATPase [Clostridiales Family XIII bacterium]
MGEEMLKRKAMDRFRFWKENKTKQALLVTGARQVGKTFLIRAFAEEKYTSISEFNLVQSPDIKASFKSAKNADDLMLRISVASGTPLVRGETLIFIDEIQECPEVVTYIKFLVDRGDYDFVLSGSLLGVELENIQSNPVGYLTVITMFPLDFEEFCWANGLDVDVFPTLRNAFETKTSVPDYLHERLMDLFHRYLIIGGMPDAVVAFLQNGQVDQVRIAQKGILDFYERDISKYAPKERRLVIKNIFHLIPSQLTSQTRRFKLSEIENIKRYTQISDEFLWLTKANVALAVYNINAPVRPLLINESQSLFKLFQSDVGLLSSQYPKQSSLSLLDGKPGANMGGIYENFVAQELKAHGFDLRYFSKHKIGE